MKDRNLPAPSIVADSNISAGILSIPETYISIKYPIIPNE
jgi:hypothetical protein